MALTTMRLKTRQFRRNLQGYSWHTEVELEKVLGWEKTHGGNLLGVWCMFLLTEPIYIFRIPYPVKLWGPKSKGQWRTASNASWRRTGLHCMCLFVYVKFVNRTAPLFTATGPILKRFEKLVMLSTNQTINPFPWQIMPKEKNPWGHCNCSFVAICSALLLGYVFHFSFAGNACTTRMSPSTWSSLRMMSKQVTNVWRSLNRSSRTWGCLTHSSHLETC